MTGAAALLIASMLGSPHCAAMCGPFVAFYSSDDGTTGSGEPRTSLHRHLAYSGGRLAAYLLLGALAGSLGLGVERAGALAGLSGLAASIAGGVMVLWGIRTMLAYRGIGGARLHGPAILQRTAGRVIALVRGKGPIMRAGLTGLSTGLLPCGWLYVFVAAAAATGTPLSGAAVMGVFWLGTVPILVSLGWGLQRLTGPLRAHLPVVTAAVVVLLGLFTIAGRLRGPEGEGRARLVDHSAHVGR